MCACSAVASQLCQWARRVPHVAVASAQVAKAQECEANTGPAGAPPAADGAGAAEEVRMPNPSAARASVMGALLALPHVSAALEDRTTAGVAALPRRRSTRWRRTWTRCSRRWRRTGPPTARGRAWRWMSRTTWPSTWRHAAAETDQYLSRNDACVSVIHISKMKLLCSVICCAAPTADLLGPCCCSSFTDAQRQDAALICPRMWLPAGATEEQDCRGYRRSAGCRRRVWLGRRGDSKHSQHNLL